MHLCGGSGDSGDGMRDGGGAGGTGEGARDAMGDGIGEMDEGTGNDPDDCATGTPSSAMRAVGSKRRQVRLSLVSSGSS